MEGYKTKNLKGWYDMRKSYITLFTFAILAFMSVNTANASAVYDYDTGIWEGVNDFGGEIPLYMLYNTYFDGYFDPADAYTSSDQMLNDIGAAPKDYWKADKSEAMGAYKIAGMSHLMQILDSDGNWITTLDFTENTTGPTLVYLNDPEKYPPASVVDETVFFMLQAFWPDKDKKIDKDNPDYEWYSFPTLNDDTLVHFLALEITDIYNAKCEAEGTCDGPFTSVYMFAWEDLSDEFNADWDYNDLVVIMTNVYACDPDDLTCGGLNTCEDPFEPGCPCNPGMGQPPASWCPSLVPEPGSILLLGTGIVALGLVARRKLGKK